MASRKRNGWLEIGPATPVDESGGELPTRGFLRFTGGVTVTDDPAVGETVVEVTGGSSAVADDIAKSAGATIDRVQGIRGIPIVNAVPSSGKTLVKRGSQYVFDQPVPPGWFDPRDYGAVCNGTTDDLPAYQAMLAAIPATGGVVHLPPGVSWLSDTLRVEKPIDLVGPSGGNRRFNCGFEVAPGRTAMILESGGISAGGGDAQQATVAGVDFRSRILIHGSANGSSLGYGIDREWNSGAIPKGGCVIASAGAHPTKFFRCTSTGLGNAAKALLAEPAWNTTVGATTTAEGATFVCEKFPVVRADSTAYAVGDRVWPVKDNRFVFECTVAGTSAGSAPADMVGGDAAPGVTIGGTVTDGTVTWTIKLAAGLVVAASVCSVERVYATGFTGPGFAVIGGTGQFAAGLTDANCSHVRDVFVEYCGVGAYYAGDNCNGWLLDGLFAINCGTLQPTPNDADAAGYTNLGGHCLHDVSLASGVVSGFYAQLSTGRCVLKNGLGRMTIVSGYEELGSGGRAHCAGGTTTILGGSISTEATSNSVIHLDLAYGKGIQAVGDISGQAVISSLFSQSKAHTIQADTGTDNVGFCGWSYGYSTPAGWWGWQHGNQVLRNAYLVSAAGAGLGYGPGWVAFQQGFLLGDPSSGTPRFFGDIGAITAAALRNGARKTGDVYDNTTERRRLTSDGYRGLPWTAATLVRASFADWGIPANWAEPTANGANPGGGLKVFECTTAGTTGGVEPNWATAVNPGDTVTDNGVVWTLRGTTPSWVVDGGGQTTIAMGNANQTVSAALAMAAVIKTTGAITANRDLSLPTPTGDGDVRVYTIRNTCTGAFSVNVRTSGGATVAVANGKTAQIGIDSAGAFRVSADV